MLALLRRTWLLEDEDCVRACYTTVPQYKYGTYCGGWRPGHPRTAILHFAHSAINLQSKTELNQYLLLADVLAYIGMNETNSLLGKPPARSISSGMCSE